MFSDHLGGWAGVQVLEDSDRDAKEAPGLAQETRAHGEVVCFPKGSHVVSQKLFLGID